MKTLPDGTPSYDFTQFKPELAESWEIAPDRSSVTFHLRKDATFHDGSPVTADDVKWSFDRAVSVGGFPGIQMGASDMKSPDQFVVVDPLTFKVDLSQAEQAGAAQSCRADRDDRQFQARQAARHRRRSLGAGLGRQERRRRRRLYGRQLEARLRDRFQTLRRLEVRPAAGDEESDRAPDRVRPARAAPCWRRATPTSPSICRRKTSPNWPRKASSRSSERRSTPNCSTWT